MNTLYKMKKVYEANLVSFRPSDYNFFIQFFKGTVSIFFYIFLWLLETTFSMSE